MDTFVGKSQKIRIDVSSIEIESKKTSTFGSKHISCDKITKVDQRGNSVFISVGSGFYASPTEIEFNDRFEAERAYRAVYNATPMSWPLSIEGNTLYIVGRYSFHGKSIRISDIQEASANGEGKLTITSDDVFDYLLDIRYVNQGIDTERVKLFDQYVSDKYEPFQLKGLDDYKEFKRKCDAKSKSRSRFIKERLMENVQEQSNGESGLYYFTNSIKENALYLLDEPENSLSASLQLKLKSFLEDSARFYHCQFIISTHSPFLLSMQGAKIYDLDSDPIDVKPWTQLENVKTYYSFFKSHEKEFF